MNRFIVVDFETTGNHPRLGDQIIQVGAVTIDDGELTRHFSTLVNPGQAIPPFISSLTGITDEMVQTAPALDEVLPDFLRLLEGRTFVAHNVDFDLPFLQEALSSHGYYPFDGPVLDTVELARILLPMQDGYRLVELTDEFRIEHAHPHRADSDALATAHLFLRLLRILQALPLVTIQRLQTLSATFRSDIAALLRFMERERLRGEPGDPDDHWDVYRQLALRKSSPERTKSEREPSGSESGPRDPDAVFSTLLAEGGSLSQSRADYRKRAEQEEMVRAIYEAMSAGAHLLVEAGTGTGKSLGYLLPSILWSKWQNQQVVISTHTLHLQEQLMDQEIPVLRQALPFPFEAAILKGRGNYLCLRKFEQSLAASAEASHETNLVKAQMVTWLTQTETGDVEELGLSPQGLLLWQQVKSDTGSCLHRHCPWFSRCYYFRAKERAKAADLVIINHALLLSDLAGDGYLLPPYDVAVIDEAHQLEEVASQQLGSQLSSGHLFFLLEQLAPEQAGNLPAAYVEALAEWEPGLRQELYGMLDELAQRAAQARDFAQKWLQTCYRWGVKRAVEQTDAGRLTVRYKQADFQGKNASMLTRTQALLDVLSQVAEETEGLLSRKPDGAPAPFGVQSTFTNLQGVVEEIRQTMETLHFLMLSGREEYVYWLEAETRTPRKHVYLYAAPLDVSGVLFDKLVQPKRSLTFTSATLTVKNSFRYLMERYGLNKLPQERVRTLVLPSPFDYERQGLLLLPTSFPSPGKETDETFLHAVVQGCLDVVREAEGGTLVLFTSHAMLRSVYEQLKPVLTEEGYLLLGHGVDSNNRSKLLRKFKHESRSVLLGASSFWEGVDIPGEALRCVVIVRLPFQPPNLPLVAGRLEKVKEEKKNPFSSLSLPHAVIRFKQGLGRLIRHNRDRGVVVVFDSRIVESRYGEVFLQSLPPFRVESGSWPALRERIRPFLAGMPSDDFS